MVSTNADRVAAAIARLPTMDHQAILTLRDNATRFGPEAQPLLSAIDERLADFEAAGGMAAHRLQFARDMLGIAKRQAGQWVASRDLFNQARLEFSDNPYVVWMAGNSARQIPLTKALETVRPEFPDLEYRKDGASQSDRVFYRFKR